jgi:hypothetical protein
MHDKKMMEGVFLALGEDALLIKEDVFMMKSDEIRK